jgi:hypothetical protein
MSENNQFWDFYWEVRLRDIEDLGKREAILAVSQLIRRLAEQPDQPVRLLELGCGEGQIIGPLVQAHAQVRSIDASLGVDYKGSSLEVYRCNYPGLRFIEGDFTDPQLLARLGQFEIVLLVNALHEVFSAAYSEVLGEVDVLAAWQRVEQALAGAVSCLAPAGYLVLFDGLETAGDLQQKLRLRFHTRLARDNFYIFAREYRPFRVTYQEVGDPYTIELSWRDFTRYITKSIFLGKPLWQTERLESYQYFDEAEFRAAFTRQGLLIRELRTLTVDYEKWRSLVEIETPGCDFPAEHILILAQKSTPVAGD